MIGTFTNFQDLYPAIFSNLLTPSQEDRYGKGQCPVFRRQGVFSGGKLSGTLIE
jgi:hypothetical protein